MAVTTDQKIVRYGTGDKDEPIAKGIKANAQLYRGTLAVTDSTGVLKDPFGAVATTDTCWGMLQKYATGCGQIDGAPGMKGGSVDGVVGGVGTSAEIEQGAFFLGSSTGGDQLSVATEGTTVYIYDGITVAATNGGSTRSPAGKHVATEKVQGVTMFAIKLGNNQSTGGGF